MGLPELGIQAFVKLLPDLSSRQMSVDIEIALADQALPHLVERAAFGRELECPLDDPHILHGATFRP